MISTVCARSERGPTCISELAAIDSIQEIASELAKRSIRCVLAVTGKSAYKRTGAWEKVEKALQENGIKCILYNGVTPNPTVDQVDLAATLGRNNGAGAVIAIGGGSALDARKVRGPRCWRIRAGTPANSARTRLFRRRRFRLSRST